MRSEVQNEVWIKHFAWQAKLDSSHMFYIPRDIKRERNFVVACNYVYEVMDNCPVPDHIYEHAVSNLELYEKYCTKEWGDCETYSDYFMQRDDWKYTGSGVPTTDKEKKLGEYLIKKWHKGETQ